jgi:hypothetical protein
MVPKIRGIFGQATNKKKLGRRKATGSPGDENDSLYNGEILAAL